MANVNQRAILEIFDEWKSKEAPTGYNEADLFELFSAQLALREFDPSPDEIQAGNVGGDGEGGIDGLYVFVNGRYFAGDADLSVLPDHPTVTLCIIQAKRGRGFSPTALHKIERTLQDLLQVYEGMPDNGAYSVDLIEAAGYFQDAVRQTIKKSPRIHVMVVYSVSEADSNEIDEKVSEAIDAITKLVPSKIGNATATVQLYDARKLIDRWSWKPPTKKELPAKDVASGDGAVALVRLVDFFKFLKNENGDLAEYLFDDNVRGVQGDVEVNRGIRETVGDAGSPQFWWLNNGVTIVCSSAPMTDNVFMIENPKIVNGLQTSWVLFEGFAAKEIEKGEESLENDNRLLLVRIITMDDEVIRDRVIRSTNSQTRITADSLVATEYVHRQIEDHFERHGLHYDRRRGHWRYKGEPVDSIISILELAQAMVSMGLNRPHEARRSPSSIFKTAVDYQRIFPEDHSIDLDVYFWAASALRRVSVFMRPSFGRATSQEKSNFQFAISMLLANRAYQSAEGRRIENPSDLSKLSGIEFDDDEILAALTEVRDVAENLLKETADATLDQIAKSRQFTDAILGRYCPLPKGKEGSDLAVAEPVESS